MKKVVVIFLMVVAIQASANQAGIQSDVHKEVLQCGAEGCEVVCHEPSKRWDSYLLAKEKIEMTYFLRTGVKQLKAEVEKGQFTILDTHPQWQSCRITGVIASS